MVQHSCQLVWSARLTSNAIRRDFYDLKSEDYRYEQFRKLVPEWFFEIVHIIVIGKLDHTCSATQS